LTGEKKSADPDLLHWIVKGVSFQKKKPEQKYPSECNKIRVTLEIQTQMSIEKKGTPKRGGGTLQKELVRIGMELINKFHKHKWGGS